MTRVNFYTSGWLVDTIGLRADEIALYITICALMYREDGPIVDDERSLAKVAGLHLRAFRRLRSELIEQGNIAIKDGRITARARAFSKAPGRQRETQF